jgi:uncharacterized damage-inducible protein DinB
MRRYSILLAALVAVIASSTVYSQTSNPLSTEVKTAYTNIKNFYLKAADKMPEDQYGFKATAEVQTFGQRIAHIADANARTCGLLKGEQKNLGASAKTTKADLVAVLKESFSYCDGVYDSLTDAEALKMISTPRGERSRLAALWGVVVHSNEVYGAMGVYMRLKGVVPPSSEGR